MPILKLLKSSDDRTVLWYVVFFVAPVLWLVADTGRYHYWAASALGIAVCTVLLAGRSRARTGIACAIAGLATLGNLPLAISLYLQRAGFNDRFFYHFDLSSLDIALNGYGLEVLLVALYWAAMTAGPVLVARHKREGSWPAAPRPVLLLAALAGVFAYAPAISLVGYVQDRLHARNAPIVVVPSLKSVDDEPPQPGRKLPNLVFVIAESLEATFGDAGLLGEDLTPALTRLEREAIRFSNMVELPEASWTMGGMVASQCGLPLPVSKGWLEHRDTPRWPFNTMNSMIAAIERPLPDEVCLGDVLERHGYRNAYLGGAPLAFAGKGAFLAAHGFEEQYGRAALRNEVSDPDAIGPWGLHDDVVFEIARERLESLAAEETPFALMLLTLDTHDVTQRAISRSCGRRPLLHQQGFTVRCADRLIADFILRVRELWPDTLVVLMSDHLSFPNAIIDRVESQAARRLRFAIWGPGLEPREVTRHGTHFDIAPTVLDALGLDAWRRHNLGASLLAFDSPWLSHENPEALRSAPSLFPVHIGPGERIVFKNDGPTLGIDGETFLANKRGFLLVDAVFTIRFHEDGRFDLIVPWQELGDLEANEPGSLVVGVSNRESFNRALGARSNGSTVYFAGRVGSDQGLMVGTVEDRTEIRLSDSMFGQPD